MKEQSLARWNSPGTGFSVSGLVEGEGGGSRDTIGLLVIIKQLLQSLQVELVIMIHLVFGGLEELGQRDGAAHCRERRCG